MPPDVDDVEDVLTRLRPLALPGGVSGKVWLSAMPGCCADLQVFLDGARRAEVALVVNLAEAVETEALAPAYAAALDSGRLPFAVLRCPIRDHGRPDDVAAFAALARDIAGGLREGARIAVHCRAGIGRTGMMAQALLYALGMSPAEAQRQVCEAGSRCENPAQARFMEQVFAQPRD